jgi:hypothetical protein
MLEHFSATFTSKIIFFKLMGEWRGEEVCSMRSGKDLPLLTSQRLDLQVPLITCWSNFSCILSYSQIFAGIPKKFLHADDIPKRPENLDFQSFVDITKMYH